MILKKNTYGLVRQFDRAKAEETRTLEFIISSSAKDRHRSIVNMDGWDLKNYMLNPIVGYQHNVYGGNMCTPDDPDDVIGEGRAWVEESNGIKQLIGSVKFEEKDINEKADKIFKKVLNGSLRATSVGFMEVGDGEWKKQVDEKGNEIDRTYYFKGQELLEFSIVNIPSNPEAVGRGIGVQADWALMYVQRFMPDNVSMKDIREMKVGDILDLVNGEVKKEAEKAIKNKTAFERRLRVSKLKNTI